jgi:hypothetical protein
MFSTVIITILAFTLYFDLGACLTTSRCETKLRGYLTTSTKLPNGMPSAKSRLT